jgi:glycosyltransferase involved in cell wall biosynthesis
MTVFDFNHPAITGLVSIVMPTHRRERLIGATLESIGRQEYDQWELIVVEDGSVGPTEEIVAAFASRHPDHRVRYIRNEKNRGAGYSRNTGFAESTGEFIALLDSDDRWLPDHLTVSVEALCSGRYDIVYSTVLMVADGSDQVLGIWGPEDGELTNFPQSLFGRNFVTPSASVMRRSVVGEIGPWSTTHGYCEDYDFWLRCATAGKTFHCVGGCHCLYRKNHPGATTERLCGMSQEVAETAERYMHVRRPGIRPSARQRHVARAFQRAARFHAERDPQQDASADPASAGALFLNAWRLQPKRLNCLVRGLWLTARYAFSKRSPQRSRRFITAFEKP